MLKKCANCASTIVFGKKDGENQYCNDICLEHHRHPGFCPECVTETTDESPGGTYTLNGIGTRLYGDAAKCPTCYSVIKGKWFCLVFIPVIPLGKYRIKPVVATRYLGRKILADKIRESQLRAASVSR